MEKKLYRSRSDRMIWGVCGGIAEYFKIDPTVVRLIAVLSIALGGFGIVAYIVMALVVPVEQSQTTQPGDTIKENIEEMKQSASALGSEIRSAFGRESTATPPSTSVKPVPPARSGAAVALGIILIALGIVFLLATFNFLWWFSWRYLWPLVLIVIGILVLISLRRK